jgi:hypothetical protein
LRWGEQRERHHLEDVGVNGRIILKCILKWGGAWTRFIWLKMGTAGGLCKCGNGHFGSKKGGDFFD